MNKKMVSILLYHLNQCEITRKNGLMVKLVTKFVSELEFRPSEEK